MQPLTPAQAWAYAADWGSLIRGGDPGACMYGFSPSFEVQSERHRADCLAWVERCQDVVRAAPEYYEAGEFYELARLADAIRRAPIAHH